MLHDVEEKPGESRAQGGGNAGGQVRARDCQGVRDRGRAANVVIVGKFPFPPAPRNRRFFRCLAMIQSFDSDYDFLPWSRRRN